MHHHALNVTAHVWANALANDAAMRADFDDSVHVLMHLTIYIVCTHFASFNVAAHVTQTCAHLLAHNCGRFYVGLVADNVFCMMNIQ